MHFVFFGWFDYCSYVRCMSIYCCVFSFVLVYLGRLINRARSPSPPTDRHVVHALLEGHEEARAAGLSQKNPVDQVRYASGEKDSRRQSRGRYPHLHTSELIQLGIPMSHEIVMCPETC